jgi:hypothetical protein
MGAHGRLILKWVRAFWLGVDCDIHAVRQKGPRAPPQCTLTETGRLRLARRVVEGKWPLRRAAERFQVSPTTAHRYAARRPGDSAADDSPSLEWACAGPHRRTRRAPSSSRSGIGGHSLVARAVVGRAGERR